MLLLLLRHYQVLVPQAEELSQILVLAGWGHQQQEVQLLQDLAGASSQQVLFGQGLLLLGLLMRVLLLVVAGLWECWCLRRWC